MKTSYVSGSNSFLAYSQGGLLNGVDYAANLVIHQQFSSSYVDVTNNYEDLLLTGIAITAGNLTGTHYLTLELITDFNGGQVTTLLWSRPYTAPDYTVSGAMFFQESFNYPFFVRDKLRFHNSNDEILDIRRVIMLFRPLVMRPLN